MMGSNSELGGPIELPDRPSFPASGSACGQGWVTGALRLSPCLLAGLMTGGLSIGVSELVGFLPYGHQFNDPLQIALAAGAALRGFRYFNWASFVVAIGVSLGLGTLSWLALRGLTHRLRKRVLDKDSDRAARAAALVSVLPVVIKEVDALQVLLWYGLATWLSMLLAGFAARSLSRYW